MKDGIFHHHLKMQNTLIMSIFSDYNSFKYINLNSEKDIQVYILSLSMFISIST